MLFQIYTNLLRRYKTFRIIVQIWLVIFAVLYI
nr:MAG TPA: hypothetical protein [Caudoviricetes sp.]